MFKMIFLIVGLVVGFGGGVYFATKNPELANKVSAEEERRFLEAQMQLTQKIRDKIDQLQSKTTSSTPGSGFVSSSQAGPTAAEVKSIKNDTEKQEAEIKKRLAELK